LNRKRYAALPPAPPVLSARADLDRLRERLNKQVLSLTRYHSSTEGLDVTESQPVDRGEYSVISLTYRVSGRRIPALLVIPAAGRSQHKTMIYLDPASHTEDPKPGSDLDQFARMGYTILAVDPSGTGKTTPRWDGYSDYWFGPDKTTWLALMVGRPLVGLRMDDIRRGIDLLSERHLLYGGNCRGFAKGLLAVNLLFAASADQRIGVLDLEGGLISYRSVAQTPIQRKIFEIVVPGILKDLDLPELAATLAPRPVRIRNLVSPLGKVEPLSRARRAYQFTDQAYDLSGSRGKFDVGLRREDETVREAYPE
jgi:hypothetical protein